MAEATGKGEVREKIDTKCSAGPDMSDHKPQTKTDKETPESKGDDETDNKKSSSASDAAEVYKDSNGSAVDNTQGCSSSKATAERPNEECGVSIPANKKGQFPKNCPWCNEDLNSLVPNNNAAAESGGHQDEIACKQYDIEIQPLTRDSECGYCCLKLIEIEEPRVLPCGHIQCTQCIVVDSQNPEIVCKVCKKEYKSAEILVKLLPEVPQVSIEVALAEPAPFIPPNLRCEMCKDHPVQAANFCADCKRKLCTNHSEDHILHTNNHELIAIEDELTPERYEVQRCEKHTIHVLNEICKHCMRLFCKRCDTGAEACTGGDAPVGITHDRASADMKADGSKQDAKEDNHQIHTIIPLLEQTTHMRDELRQKSQAIYNKMKRCRDMEKSTWKELSEVEDAVTAAHLEIDTIANDMIRKIKDEADGIKAKFTDFYNDMSAEVDEFSEDKLIGVTKLDVMYMEGQQLADRRPDSQLLKDFTDVSARLIVIEKDISFDRQLFIKMPYLDRGTPTAIINARLISAPMSIEYVSTAKKSDTYYGVKWIEGGRVLCSTSSGLELRLADLTLEKQIGIEDQAFSADSAGDKLFTHIWSGKKCINYIGTQEEPHQNKVHEQTDEGGSKITHISASKEMLAVVDYTDKMLKVMTVSGEHMFDIKLLGMKQPFGVHLLPADNSVLVTDCRQSGELRKYRLEPDAEPVWTCAGLVKSSGITTDELGLIYVTSNTAGKIYVITPQGKKIHELTHSKLTKAVEKEGWNHDISVSDGKMAVACRDQGVMMFNIK